MWRWVDSNTYQHANDSEPQQWKYDDLWGFRPQVIIVKINQLTDIGTVNHTVAFWLYRTLCYHISARTRSVMKTAYQYYRLAVTAFTHYPSIDYFACISECRPLRPFLWVVAMANTIPDAFILSERIWSKWKDLHVDARAHAATNFYQKAQQHADLFMPEALAITHVFETMRRPNSRIMSWFPIISKISAFDQVE